MNRYNDVYSWEVFDKIEQGKSVYVVDRKEREVYFVNGMPVDKAMEITKCKEEDRYSFWAE